MDLSSNVFCNMPSLDCRVKWERVNVSWTDNGDYLEYSLKKTYQFVPELSAGSEEDVLTMINIPLAVSRLHFLHIIFQPIKQKL